MLELEVCPIDGVDMNSELEAQAKVAAFCIAHPNNDDNSRSLFEAVNCNIFSG